MKTSRDQAEADGLPPRSLAVRREGHGDRRRGDHREDAGGVGAGLRIHVGPEEDRDHDADGGEDEDQRANGPRPLRGHAVARQVARDDVEQAGHRRGAGEPEDQDRADVVERAESVAKEFMGKVGERPAVGLPPSSKASSGMSNVVTMLLVSRKTLMISGHGQEEMGVADRPAGFAGVSAGSPLTSGITTTPVSKPGEPERQLGEDQQRRADHRQRVCRVLP